MHFLIIVWCCYIKISYFSPFVVFCITGTVSTSKNTKANVSDANKNVSENTSSATSTAATCTEASSSTNPTHTVSSSEKRIEELLILVETLKKERNSTNVPTSTTLPPNLPAKHEQMLPVASVSTTEVPDCQISSVTVQDFERFKNEMLTTMRNSNSERFTPNAHIIQGTH